MREKWKIRVKRIMSIFCSVLVLSLGVFSTSFVSDAETIEQLSYQDFIVNYPEPTCGEYQGYINLLIRSLGSDGTYGTADDVYSIRTFFWYTYGMSGTAKVPVSAYIGLNTNTDTFTFSLAGNTSISTTAYYCISQIDDTGTYYSSTGTSSPFTYNVGQWGLEIVGYKYKGNVGKVSITGGTPSGNFTVIYGNDSSAELLHDIYETLMSIEDIDDRILFRVNEIWQDTTDINQVLVEMKNILNTLSVDNYEQLNALNTRLEELLDEQKESNSWLEKIWNSLQEFFGLQNEESTEALPDEEVDSVLQEEESLIQDTTDAESDLEFSIDADSNNVTWGVIDGVLNAHPRVFGAFLAIMTLGVVTLLLNR